MPEGAPKDVHVRVLNDSAISVSWREPIEKSGRIRGYFVYYLHVKDNFELYPHKTQPAFLDADSSEDRVSFFIFIIILNPGYFRIMSRGHLLTLKIVCQERLHSPLGSTSQDLRPFHDFSLIRCFY